MKTLRFPKAFDHLTLEQLEKLPTKVIYMHEGILCGATYDNLDEAAAHHDGFRGYMGPFACRLNGELCIRFEDQASCDLLSN